MARVALVKLFTGLNLGVSQLAGELRRAGHEYRTIYFKDFLVVPIELTGRYLVADYAGVAVSARAQELVWNCYRPFTDEEYGLLFDELRALRPDLIGFSLSSLVLNPAGEVTRRIKREFDVPIVWGGQGPTLEPERCLDLGADLVCVNEGEEVIVELADRIDADGRLDDVAGTWARGTSGVVRNPARPLVDVERIAIPDFEPTCTVHINDGKVRRNVYPPNLGHQYVIMTTRGCPFSCSFCIESVYQEMFGKKGHLRRRSVDLVMEELTQAKRRYGIRSVFFFDDVFTTHPRWLKEFCERYPNEIALPFWCYTYPTTTKRDEIRMLKRAGCMQMTMGIQSGSESLLSGGLNRPVPKEKAIEAAQVMIEEGVDCYFDLITKIQIEKEEDARATFDFLCDLPVEMKTIGFGHMTMFPGYGYTAQVEEGGHHLSMTDKEYAYYHKLYLLTRTHLPRPVIRTIGKLPLFRRFPRLIDPLLPKTLDWGMLLDDEADIYSHEIMNLPHAQAVIPGGELDRGL